MESNIGELILQGFSLLMGLVLIGFAVNAIRTGRLVGSNKIVHGTPTGTDYISRQSRPVAFWFCVAAYFLFGFSTIGCALFFI